MSTLIATWVPTLSGAGRAGRGVWKKSDLKQNRVNKQQTEKRLKQKANKTAKA